MMGAGLGQGARSIPVAADDVAPSSADEVSLALRQAVFVRLVGADACEVVLESRQAVIEAAELKMIVDLSDLARRVPDQVFVAQFVELSGAQQRPACFQLL